MAFGRLLAFPFFSLIPSWNNISHSYLHLCKITSNIWAKKNLCQNSSASDWHFRNKIETNLFNKQHKNLNQNAITDVRDDACLWRNYIVLACFPKASVTHSVNTASSQRSLTVHDAWKVLKKLVQRVHSAPTARLQRAHGEFTARTRRVYSAHTALSQRTYSVLTALKAFKVF